jgi:IPT/TIG domain
MNLSGRQTAGGDRRRSFGTKRSTVLALAAAFVVMIVAVPASGTVRAAAAGQTTGVMVLANRTITRGVVWINDDLGGHWWASDGGAGTGLCRIDAAPLATPKWSTNWCSGTVRSGGEIVVGNTPTTAADGSKYIYVADDASKSTQVVRYRFNPHATAAQNPLTSTLVLTVNNVTAVGGGTGGGRPVGLALAPNGQDLYVGYLKSGDIMKVTDAMHTASGTPPVAKIGTTSDGRGLNSLVLVRNDLYLGELGGLGLSEIQDPSGVARTACSAAGQCTAVTVPGASSISSFPGGLATDGTRVYVADAPGITGSIIKRLDPVSGSVDVISSSVQTYFDAFDNVAQTHYTSAMGLGVAPNGDIYVGDDPTVAAGVATAGQGHVFVIPASAQLPATTAKVTSLAPSSGATAGGDVVTITGTDFDPTAGATTVNFGTNPGVNVSCASTTTCTATSPAGTGTVDVIVSVSGQPSQANSNDQFTYIAPPPVGTLSVTSVTPGSAAASGGTTVRIKGTEFDITPGNTTVNFGPSPATNVSCTDVNTCTALAPTGTGTVDVQVSTAAGGTSPISAGDRFTYVVPQASLYAWGVTAPKGGVVWLPGAGGQGGHWWSSDHAQGICRQDAAPTSGPFGVPGNTLHALNLAVCGDDIVGSAGQAVYDPRPFPAGATGCPAADECHFVYVPDNAVKSVAVWRLVFDATTETMVGPATGMAPLADLRTLKPNGMALGPLDANGQPVANAQLYVSDLTEMNIRSISNPAGDTRTQVVSIVAQTGDARGANGTMGFIGNKLFVSENRGTAYFDVTAPCTTTNNCATQKVALNAPAAGVFVAGTATDPAHGYVYVSDSPGGANATIYRFNANTITVANPAGSPAPVYLTGGTLPTAGSPNATVFCSTTCQRPWDFANHPTQGGPAGFSFAFGLAVGPTGDLVVTEDPSAGNRSGRGTIWLAPFVP